MGISVNWPHLYKFFYLCAGGAAGTMLIMRWYEPTKQFDKDVEAGKERLRQEYEPKYEALRRQLLEEVAKMDAKNGNGK